MPATALSNEKTAWIFRFGWKRMVAACALLPVLASVASAKSLEDQDWLRLDSDGVTVYTNGNGREARALNAGLYLLRKVAPAIPGISTADLDRPVEVVRFHRRSEVAQLGFSRYALTMKQSGFRRHTFVMQDDENINELTFILRSYAHLLIHNTEQYVGIRWLHSGLADYLAGISWGKGKVYVGIRPAHITSPLRRPPWLSIDRILVESKAKELHPRRRSRFRAQSWLLVHYLLSLASEEHPFAKDMREYKSLVDAGADELVAFEAVTGLETESLNRKLKAYDRKCCLAFTFDSETAFEDISVKSRAASRSEMSLVFGRLALSADAVAARRWFEIAADDEKFKAAAEAQLGELEFRAENYDLALSHFQLAAELAPGSSEAQLDLGRYWVRRAANVTQGSERSALLANARAALLDAWKLHRESAEVYYLNALTYLLDSSDIQKAVEMLEEASYLQADNLQILETLADVYLQLGNRAEAIRVSELMATMDHGDSLSELQSTIDQSIDGASPDDQSSQN